MPLWQEPHFLPEAGGIVQRREAELRKSKDTSSLPPDFGASRSYGSHRTSSKNALRAFDWSGSQAAHSAAGQGPPCRVYPRPVKATQSLPRFWRSPLRPNPSIKRDEPTARPLFQTLGVREIRGCGRPASHWLRLSRQWRLLEYLRRQALRLKLAAGRQELAIVSNGNGSFSISHAPWRKPVTSPAPALTRSREQMLVSLTVPP